MKRVALPTIKDQLSRYLRVAEKDAVVVLRHGKRDGGQRGIVEIIRESQ